jgi:hypothetical protein
MNTNDQSPGEQKPPQISSFKVLGARLTWAVLGPLALLATAWVLASRRKTWLTGLDLLFAAIVGLMILGRRVEQRSGAATTLTGEPATEAQCQRYTVGVLVIAALAWLAAKVLANYVLT